MRGTELEPTFPKRLLTPTLQIPEFDIHTDMPVELLHSFLLGPVKYLLRHTMAALGDEKKATLHARLRSIDVKNCFFRPLVISQIMIYTGSLSGKDFKTFLQLAPFALQGIGSQAELNFRIAISTSGSLAFRRKYTNDGEALRQLQAAIDYVLAMAIPLAHPLQAKLSSLRKKTKDRTKQNTQLQAQNTP
ncbi:uncharacterized protein EV422DRAFT_333891 [Fimicolochytrium jonesii]|uniref:uncharacterized protein n=1 Tax=Fimicolochytrium jonesii TaxID=1396493 RepID=UPI0022FE6A31|nr:uncharacterized protein EV422DRAFT_333891 [Fimicolochytrium jonesii]KAI8816110.1 hypothetical protein EV422DRAFT_333891 [Fimicolochytrium jonesii]